MTLETVEQYKNGTQTTNPQVIDLSIGSCAELGGFTTFTLQTSTFQIRFTRRKLADLSSTARAPSNTRIKLEQLTIGQLKTSSSTLPTKQATPFATTTSPSPSTNKQKCLTT
ncbi:MAG: hypothetical protein ACLQO7_06440 [Candidatus Bathyarchaeia archaeon]